MQLQGPLPADTHSRRLSKSPTAYYHVPRHGLHRSYASFGHGVNVTLVLHSPHFVVTARRSILPVPEKPIWKLLPRWTLLCSWLAERIAL